MPLRTNATNSVAGSGALAWGRRIQDDRHGQRGKNGFAQQSETRKLRYIAWRDGGTRASCALQSALAPTLVSVLHNPVR